MAVGATCGAIAILWSPGYITSLE